MEIIIILAIVVAVIKVLSFVNKLQSLNSNSYTQKDTSHYNENIINTPGLTEDQKGYIGNRVINLYARKGYKIFSIAGIYYRNLPITEIGKFEGRAVLDPNNLYDKKAIAIYNDNNERLGYIPKGEYELHNYITTQGGSVHVYGYAAYNNSMYGFVCVEVDKTLVGTRKKSEKK